MHAAWGSLGQPPFKRWVKSLNILIEAQILTSPPCCHLQPRCLMAHYYLENSDTYHNEAQIHWIYHTSKRSCGRVLFENDTKNCLKGMLSLISSASLKLCCEHLPSSTNLKPAVSLYTLSKTSSPLPPTFIQFP